MHDTRSQTVRILQVQRIGIVSQVFTRRPFIRRFFNGSQWCHLPVLQRLQLMLPHLVLIERAVSRLFSICKCCGKGNCKATVGSRGDHRQQGGTRYGCDIWSGGTDYSAVDSPGGPLSRGNCPRRDSTTPGDIPPNPTIHPAFYTRKVSRRVESVMLYQCPHT